MALQVIMASKASLVLLLVAILVAGAASQRRVAADHLLPARRSLLNKQEASAEQAERQRILAELEEVHQLRERMLQEGQMRFLQFRCQTCTCMHSKQLCA